MGSIGQLELVLTANTTKLTEALSTITARLDRLQKDSAKTASALENAGKKISGALGMAKTAAVALTGVLATAFAGGKIINSFNLTADTLDKIGEAAARLDASVETLSTLRYMGELNGVTFEEVVQIFDAFRNNLGKLDAVDGGRAKAFLQKLNIELEDTAGKLRPVDELFREVSDAIKRLPSGQQGAFFKAIFGDTRAAQLGLEQFRAAMKEGGVLGVVFSDAQVRAADEYRDAITRLDNAWTGLMAKLVEKVGPVLADVLNKTATFVSAIPELLNGLWESIGNLRIDGSGQGMSLVWEKLGTLIRVGVRDLGVVAFESLKAVGKLVTSAFFDDLYKLIEFEFYTMPLKIARLASSVGRTILTTMMPDAENGPLLTWVKGWERSSVQFEKALETFTWIRSGGASGQSLRQAFDSADFAAVGRAVEEMTRNVSLAGDEFLSAGDLGQRFLKILGEHKINAEALGDAVKRLNQNLKEVPQNINELEERMKEFGTNLGSTVAGFAQSAGDAFAQLAIDGKASFADLAKGWARALVSMAMQTLIFKPIFDAIGTNLASAFGGQAPAQRPGAGGGLSQPGGRIAYAANGAVLNGNGIVPFANGGIVNRPTYFPLRRGTGLMGEAGPEGIFPLERRGGKLGIRAGGGGVTVNIVDQRGSGAKPEVSESTGPDGRKMISVVIRDEVRKLIGEGSFDKSMGQNFGIRRVGVAR